ncbi:flavodoxin family protein [Paeniglutamicibacter sp.]|uniref:flavodoxin family protein n=1 Tax=Paeniglutamicibacter sp. TaxID=1934391 RepID=UPI0039895841
MPTFDDGCRNKLQLGGRTLKAAVVYESMYGNTHRIAQAIAEGLATATDVVSVYAVGRIDLRGLDLLVVGGPTHEDSDRCLPGQRDKTPPSVQRGMRKHREQHASPGRSAG